MKRSTKAAILYYLVLLSGFLIFVGAVTIGGIYYPDEVQSIVDNYPYIVFPSLILFFVGYLYAIKRVVLTKDFQQFERDSMEKAEKNKECNIRRMKIAIPILAVFSVVNMIFSFYIIFKVRSGAYVNYIFKGWSRFFTIPFIILFLVIHCYRHSKKMIEVKAEETSHNE